MTKIARNLYIGSRWEDDETDHRINLMMKGLVGEHNFPLRDNGKTSPELLAQAVLLVDELMKDGRVYVHCRWGRSRSVLVCATWWAWKHRKSLDEGLKHIKDRYERARPNRGLLRVAKRSLKMLRG